MYINEYGDSKAPKILMLHPMEVSGENLYNLMKSCFRGNYCYIAPDQGGHGKSEHYVSQIDEYQTLSEYLLRNGYSEIDLLYGASMGCSIAVLLMQDSRFKIKKVWLDGAWISDKSGLLGFLMKIMFLKKLKSFCKNPEVEPTGLIHMYGKKMGYLMRDNFVKFSANDIKRICHAFTHFSFENKNLIPQENIHIEWGEKDINLKVSAKGMKKYFPKVVATIRKESGHCGFMVQDTEKYVKEIESFINV